MSHFQRAYVLGGSLSLSWKPNGGPQFFARISPAFSYASPFANAVNAGPFGLTQWFCSTISFMF